MENDDGVNARRYGAEKVWKWCLKGALK